MTTVYGEVLAGPILRNCEPDDVSVWFATLSEPTEVTMPLSSALPNGAAQSLGALDERTKSIQLGRRLWVTLHRARLRGKRLPTETFITYDLRLKVGGGEPFSLLDGLPGGRESLTYPGFTGPTFFFPGESREALTFAFGSCRKLHGYGVDMMEGLDIYLATQLRTLRQRPSMLILNGDQIYADEVPDAMLEHIHELLPDLVGYPEELPGLKLAKPGKRRSHLKELGFTTEEGSSHVLTFGEYCLLYLLYWNEALWPPSFGTKRTNATDALQNARLALPAVRRVMANCPTYMFFDDHEVTDDWNLDFDWRKNVLKSKSGRRVIAHALGAYTMFQAWGNAPRTFPDRMVDAVGAYARALLQSPQRDGGGALEKSMWDFDEWSFATPSNPPVFFLDTRTQRDFWRASGRPGGPYYPRLVKESELRRLRDLARAKGLTKRSPLVMSIATPVYGHPGIEEGARSHTGRYSKDHENWMTNVWSYIDLITFLVEEIEPSLCVFLSGDLHYAFNLGVNYLQSRPHRRATGPSPTGPKPLRIHQITSSAIKNAPPSNQTWEVEHLLPMLGTGRVSAFEGQDREAIWHNRWNAVVKRLEPPVRSYDSTTSDPLFAEAHDWVLPGRSRQHLIFMSNIGVVTIWPREKRSEHVLISGKRSGTEATFWTYVSDLR
ncbi:MAG: hypothetical protein HS111_06770 [Kofleriaceae bacterium]|nr:hypothetical protein [Kofleriaceae bacterium]